MSRKGFCFAVISILFLVYPCIAKSQTSSSESLGDLARRLREERARQARKPQKVYTNDNMPAAPKEEGRTAAGGISAQPAAPSEKKAAAASSAGESAAAEKHDEKYYRARMNEIQRNLDVHKRELEVLQQKLGLNQTQFYNDPNKTLQQEYSRSDINTLNNDIAKKKDQIAQDEKDMDDLRDQLRREGGDPGWIR